jgi:flavin-dependent dehydrogenase
MSSDLLVVGAGPAGVVAATVAARAGARVRLIDRATFPRPKLCGDTLNPGAVALLRRLGFATDIEREGLRLAGMLVTGEGTSVEACYPDGLYGVAMSRERLDVLLLEAAVRAGVEVCERVAAQEPLVDARSGAAPRVSGARCRLDTGVLVDMPARVTVAADGRHSTLAFALGLARHPVAPRRWAVGAYATGVHGLQAHGEMHIRRGHYVGIAPLPGGLANVCLVRPAVAGDLALHDPRAALTDAVRSDALLRDRFADAQFIGRPLVLGPLAVEATRAQVPSGLVLAGDAAGFIDPMTGDGMRFALRGGELAAHAALCALQHGWDEVHASLAVTRQREFGGKWRFNRVLRGVVGSAVAVRGAGVGARLAPGIVRALIRHASDCRLAAAGRA